MTRTHINSRFFSGALFCLAVLFCFFGSANTAKANDSLCMKQTDLWYVPDSMAAGSTAEIKTYNGYIYYAIAAGLFVFHLSDSGELIEDTVLTPSGTPTSWTSIEFFRDTLAVWIDRRLNYQILSVANPARPRYISTGDSILYGAYDLRRVNDTTFTCMMSTRPAILKASLTSPIELTVLGDSYDRILDVEENNVFGGSVIEINEPEEVWYYRTTIVQMGHVIYQEDSELWDSDYFDPWSLALHDSICVVVGSNPSISSYRYRGSSENMIRLDTAVFDSRPYGTYVRYADNVVYSNDHYCITGSHPGIKIYSVAYNGSISEDAHYTYSDTLQEAYSPIVFDSFIVVLNYHDETRQKGITVFKYPLIDGNCEAPSLPLNLCLKASPNPFNGRLEINTELSNSVDIYDIRGKLCATKNCSSLRKISDNRFLWNPENESSGVYLIRANNGETTEVIKVAYIK